MSVFKVVNFYDNLHYEIIVESAGESWRVFDNKLIWEKAYEKIVVPNIPVIKQNIESELRKQITANNSKHKLSCQ